MHLRRTGSAPVCSDPATVGRWHSSPVYRHFHKSGTKSGPCVSERARHRCRNDARRKTGRVGVPCSSCRRGHRPCDVASTPVACTAVIRTETASSCRSKCRSNRVRGSFENGPGGG